MPTYFYRCESCKKEEEIIQKISEPALTTCPFCNAATFKRVPPKEVAIQFKGSGFYITDYDKKNSPDAKGGCGKGSCGCH